MKIYNEATEGIPRDKRIELGKFAEKNVSDFSYETRVYDERKTEKVEIYYFDHGNSAYDTHNTLLFCKFIESRQK